MEIKKDIGAEIIEKLKEINRTMNYLRRESKELKAKLKEQNEKNSS